MYRRRRRWLTPALLLLDFVLINLAFVIAYYGRYEWEWVRPVAEANYVPLREYLPISLGLTAILLAVYWTGGLYTPKRTSSWLDEVYAIVTGTLIGIAIVIVITFFYRPYFYSRLIFAYAGILIAAIVSLSRLIIRQIWARLRKTGAGVDRVLIVGAGEVGRAVMRSIMAQPEFGYQVVGFLDDNPEMQGATIGRFEALGGTDDLSRVMTEHQVEEVIITLPWTSHQTIMKMVAHCEEEGVRARLVPDLFEMSISRVDMEEIGGVPLLGIKEVSIQGWNLAVKRAIDIVLSALALLVLSPLLIIIAVLIKIESPGPALFRQERVGKQGRIFNVYKFRSMRQEADSARADLRQLNEAVGPFFKMKDDPRCTRLGRFLRRSSLDETPQFYNVLKGEMSLVGPRPSLPDEVERYQDWHIGRLDLVPGITGLWQVMGRSDLTFDEMVMLDLFYAENWSLWLDFKILIMTIPTVILGRGAY